MALFIFLQQQYHFNGEFTIKFAFRVVYLRKLRLLFFILTGLMLWMSCLPCADSRSCDETSSVTNAVNANTQQHHHDSESCTPFCSCSCCSLPILFTSFTKENINKPVSPSLKFPLFNISLIAEAHYSIWQPPQLAWSFFRIYCFTFLLQVAMLFHFYLCNAMMYSIA